MGTIDGDKERLFGVGHRNVEGIASEADGIARDQVVFEGFDKREEDGEARCELMRRHKRNELLHYYAVGTLWDREEGKDSRTIPFKSNKYKTGRVLRWISRRQSHRPQSRDSILVLS